MRSIRRILIAQPYGIGDALFTTPLLRALRTLPTVEEVDLLLGSRTEAVFRNNPHVDQIFSLDKGQWHQEGSGRMVRDAFSLWKTLKGRYDLLLDFSLQREYGFYGGLFLQIPRRIGFNFKNRGLFLTQSLALPDGFDGQHVIDFYCELGRLMGLEIDERFPEFYLSGENREEASRILEKHSISDSSRFIAVAPGGGESWGKDAALKRWPVASFLELLGLMKNRIGFEGVLVLGSQTERELGEEIERESPVPAVNLCGELTLGGCAAVLEKSSLLAANDGGLVHLAHALRVPLVAFYGPANPKVYGPYPETPEAIAIAKRGLPCRPCYFRFRYNSACSDKACLTDLSAGEVTEFLDQKNFWSVLCGKS